MLSTYEHCVLRRKTELPVIVLGIEFIRMFTKKSILWIEIATKFSDKLITRDEID